MVWSSKWTIQTRTHKITHTELEIISGLFYSICAEPQQPKQQMSISMLEIIPSVSIVVLKYYKFFILQGHTYPVHYGWWYTEGIYCEASHIWAFLLITKTLMKKIETIWRLWRASLREDGTFPAYQTPLLQSGNNIILVKWTNTRHVQEVFLMLVLSVRNSSG